MVYSHCPVQVQFAKICSVCTVFKFVVVVVVVITICLYYFTVDVYRLIKLFDFSIGK